VRPNCVQVHDFCKLHKGVGIVTANLNDCRMCLDNRHNAMVVSGQ